MAMKNISAIILSAGKSVRFGQPKAFLPFDEGKSFLQKIIDDYINSGIDNIILVINPLLSEEINNQIKNISRRINLKIVINNFPDKGRFTSIKLALAELDHGYHSFIQNIDNPFISSDLLIAMASKISNGNFIVPVYNKVKGHPVLLSTSIINRIRNINLQDLNLKEILKEYTSISIDCDDPKIIANINTREDYLKYFTSYLSLNRIIELFKMKQIVSYEKTGLDSNRCC